jgi:rare lipoprotein A
MNQLSWWAKALFALCLSSISLASFAESEEADTAPVAQHQVGIASYYSDKFHGRRTANGERYDRNALTAVHSHLPFGTIIRVTNLSNHRSVELRINDRKHPNNHRLLDVSKRAASELGFIGTGLAKVEIEVIRRGNT